MKIFTSIYQLAIQRAVHPIPHWQYHIRMVIIILYIFISMYFLKNKNETAIIQGSFAM